MEQPDYTQFHFSKPGNVISQGDLCLNVIAACAKVSEY